ncbi:MAG: hypothetical protein RMJ97_12415, partial [Raineya sp.]|nr:hypothetical protein [Raineya sp.]
MKIRFWFRKCQTNSQNPIGILYGYVMLNGIRSKEFSTGISVCKKHWDAKQQRIKNNSILQQELENLKNLLFKAKQKLEFEKPNFTANEVLDMVVKKKVATKTISFIELWQQFITIRQKQDN